MLKWLAIFAIATSLQAFTPMPGQAVKSATQGSNQVQEQGKRNHASAAPTPPLVNSPVQAGSSNTHGGEVADKDKENTVTLTGLPPVTVAPITIVDKQKTRWDRVFDWGPWIFSGLLVVVGGFQVWLLWRTLGAIKKQADIQAVAMRQWVNVVPLRVHLPPNFMETGEATIQFEVVNRTDYLLTIIQTEVEIMPNIQTSRKFTVNCDVPLVPQKSAQDSSYPFYGTAHAPVGSWSDDGKMFVVGGTVTYRDSVGIRQTQDFHDLYRGYLDGRLERMKPSGLVPEEENSKAHSQNPN